MNAVRRVSRELVIDYGWQSGSDLEDAAALDLIRAGWTPRSVAQQYRVDPYRLDFAWPGLSLAMEVDGWMHRSPDVAARDAERDAFLRHEGWTILRVDDRNGIESMRDQIARVSTIACALSPTGRPS